MIRHNPYRLSIFAAIVLNLLFITHLSATDGYKSLLQSMKTRQTQLEVELKNPVHCLGERLDGLLEINANCSAETRELAEAENTERMTLNKLMSAELKLSPEQVGQQRAKRYLNRYQPGILRQIRLSTGEITWWNGYSSSPEKTRISRILTLNYARIHQNPDSNSPVVRDNIHQYEAFGVVDSTTDGTGKNWYQVTEEYVPKIKPKGWSPKILGWISESWSIPWRRALVMRFTNNYQRVSSFFFQQPEAALQLARLPTEERNSKLEAIKANIGSTTADGNSVIAMEPRTSQEQTQAIIYPILDYYSRQSEETLRIDGMSARLLEVAARTRSEGVGGYGDQDIPLDIVFVMDTTHSMYPYFQEALSAIKEFAISSKGGSIRFGFISYQDKGVGFDHEVKEFTQEVQLTDDFVSTLNHIDIRHNPVKDDDIPEAVFKGIDTALESKQWREEAIKIIFLVGDAPGRKDELNLQNLHDKSFNRRINIFAFHIYNSVVSKKLDPTTKNQYSKLSSIYIGAQGSSKQQSHLIEINANAPQFKQIMLKSFLQAQQDLDVIQNCVTTSCDLPESNPGTLSNLIFRQASLLMADNSLPEQEIRGWVFDKVLTDPDRQALAPMILLTESELDELSQRVSELRDIGEQALRGEGGTTLDFFDLVKRNTRFTMVDPTAVNFRDAFSVPLGIDELPYDSDIMVATRDEFGNMDRVQDFVRGMRNKLRYYEDLRRQRGNPRIWKQLSTGASERDQVVAVELDYLP